MKYKSKFFFMVLIICFLFPIQTLAKKEQQMEQQPMVFSQVLDKAKMNTKWKTAFATAKHAQIVFMNITPDTNPKNEIGMEKHPFDQVILVVEGDGKTVLDGKTTIVHAGDMIFIPQGTNHNVINTNDNKPLKILSFYSSNDIKANSNYDKNSDEPHEEGHK